MAFDDLPARPRANFPAAIAYAQDVLARSRAAAQDPAIAFAGDRAFGPDYDQRVDVYAPRGAGGGLPVLLFLHGGAWTGGYKEWMGFMAPAILATPAIFVSVSYRLAPEALYPAAVEDTAAAVRWVRDNIADHGGDPARIFIGGHSAGAHLAALVAFDRRWLAAQGVAADIIRGVLPVSGSFDLAFDPADPGNAPHIAIRDRFLPAGTDIAAASPLTHVDAAAPPCLVAVGGEDFDVLIDDARALGAALTAAGVAASVLIVPGHDHFDISARCTDDGHPWLVAARRMLAG